MSKKLEDRINEIVQARIEVELAGLTRQGVKPQLADIIRSGYERWNELSRHAKEAGLDSGNEYLSKVINEEFGLTTNSQTIRSTLSRVRVERGERVFKKDGKPHKNKAWGK